MWHRGGAASCMQRGRAATGAGALPAGARPGRHPAPAPLHRLCAPAAGVRRCLSRAVLANVAAYQMDAVNLQSVEEHAMHRLWLSCGVQASLLKAFSMQGRSKTASRHAARMCTHPLRACMYLPARIHEWQITGTSAWSVPSGIFDPGHSGEAVDMHAGAGVSPHCQAFSLPALAHCTLCLLQAVLTTRRSSGARMRWWWPRGCCSPPRCKMSITSASCC